MSSETEVNYLERLPTELVVHILSYIDAKSLCYIARTCRMLNNIAQSVRAKCIDALFLTPRICPQDLLWKPLLQQEYCGDLFIASAHFTCHPSVPWVQLFGDFTLTKRRVEAAWHAIETLPLENAIRESLQPGRSSFDISELASDLGVALPFDFAYSLTIHDGTALPPNVPGSHGFIESFSFLSSSQLIQLYQQQITAPTAEAEKWNNVATSLSYVKQTRSTEYLVPFLIDDHDTFDMIAIDVDPQPMPGGQWGQVIGVFQFPVYTLMSFASSFVEFLEAVVAQYHACRQRAPPHTATTQLSLPPPNLAVHRRYFTDAEVSAGLLALYQQLHQWQSCITLLERMLDLENPIELQPATCSMALKIVFQEQRAKTAADEVVELSPIIFPENHPNIALACALAAAAYERISDVQLRDTISALRRKASEIMAIPGMSQATAPTVAVILEKLGILVR